MSFGQKISQYRKLRNITQTELATRLHVHQTQIARWEKDRARPRHDYVSQLAEVLEIPIQELTAAEAHDLSGVSDEELRSLLLRVNELNPSQTQALKTMLGDMLRLTRFQRAINE